MVAQGPAGQIKVALNKQLHIYTLSMCLIENKKRGPHVFLPMLYCELREKLKKSYILSIPRIV